MRQALDRELNRIILELAPAHVARDVAPETFRDLMTAHGQGGEMPVWAGASDATIYADERVNHAARAWHDGHHIAGLHDFTLAGETAACERQIVELLRRYPSAPRRALDIIRAEVIGQATYAGLHGAFPVDQYAFTLQTIGG
jgi:hypothetical protein